MMIGVVLAAGKSERLLNKVLLPKRNGEPVIHSAIKFSKLHCDRTIVVTSGVVTEYVKHGLCMEVLEREPMGVTHALRSAYMSVTEYNPTWLVLFGDNVYSGYETLPTETGLASIRKVEGDQLDGWDGNKWVDRSELPVYKLAGWLYLTNNQFRTIGQADNLISGVNQAEVKSFITGVEWYDIGTPESYAAYLRGGK